MGAMGMKIFKITQYDNAGDCNKTTSCLLKKRLSICRSTIRSVLLKIDQIMVLNMQSSTHKEDSRQ
uniref:Uncharacterized protein n=1 Tax=Arion vulgaris TaxID=1028688 RepID=A0A0B6ZGU5_9EUPU